MVPFWWPRRLTHGQYMGGDGRLRSHAPWLAVHSAPARGRRADDRQHRLLSAKWCNPVHNRALSKQRVGGCVALLVLLRRRRFAHILVPAASSNQLRRLLCCF